MDKHDTKGNAETIAEAILMQNAGDTRLTAHSRHNWLRGIVNLNERNTLTGLFHKKAITDKFIVHTINFLQTEFKDNIWKKRNIIQKLKETSKGRNIKKAFKQSKASIAKTINKVTKNIKKFTDQMTRQKKRKKITTPTAHTSHYDTSDTTSNLQCLCLDDLEYDPITDIKEQKKQKLKLRAEWIGDLATTDIEHNIKTKK